MVNGVPTLTIDLGAANSVYGWDYGGEVAFLDLSWYTPYKPTVDNIVGGFLWLIWLFAVFKRAPGIITGASMTGERLDAMESRKEDRS